MTDKQKERLRRVMQKMSDRLGCIGFSHPHLSPDDWTNEEKADYQTILSLIDRVPSEEEAYEWYEAIVSALREVAVVHEEKYLEAKKSLRLMYKALGREGKE